MSGTGAATPVEEHSERPVARYAVRVSAAALRRIRQGSPWVFDGSIRSITPARDARAEPAAGDLGVVFDDRRRFVAIGLIDPVSPIRLRILHAGAPCTVDESFWRGRLDAVAHRRDELAASGTTNAYRMVHGENDGLGGLVVDRYDSTLVIKIYSAAWEPHLGTVIRILADRADVERVVVRRSRTMGARPPEVFGTALDGPVIFREHGRIMAADVVSGNKTGHFLDQRDNRSLVGSLAAGTRLLDVFSNSGGFSVAAALGGARSLTLVDISAPALAAARHNLELNGFGTDESVAHRAADPMIRCEAGDAFEVLGHLRRRGERFDLVVVDPPAFATAQRHRRAALGAYARLTRAAIALIEPGGVLVQASCSSRIGADEFNTLVEDELAAAGTYRVLYRTGHPIDHPIGFDRGAYLKAIFARVG